MELANKRWNLKYELEWLTAHGRSSMACHYDIKAWLLP